MILVVGKFVGNVICSEVKNENVDLIVIGVRGFGIARRIIFGSVSDYVVYYIYCFVCVVLFRVMKEDCL